MTYSKYILQYGNIGGWPYLYAKMLREMAVNSISIAPIKSDCDYMGVDGKALKRQLPTDKFLLNANTPKIITVIKKVLFTLEVTRDCNLIHYHGGPILNYGQFDTRIFSKNNIPMVISWAGGDARIISMARKNNPYFYKLPGITDEARDKQVKRHLHNISKYVRFVATDPELAEYSEYYFEKVFLLRQPIDLNQGKCIFPDINTKKPIVMHLPTHPFAKGTIHIQAAVDRLKSEGLDFEFRQLESNFTQSQVRELLSEVDIYVDEILCGSYGLTAIESMSCGKPTIVYIREDLLEKYPADLPLVNANPDTIYMKLKELIEDAKLRNEIGQKSRKYVEKYHSLEVIGPQLLEIYKEIGWKSA